MVSFQITPEPSKTERQAILEALAAEDAERAAAPKWPTALLPARESEEGEP